MLNISPLYHDADCSGYFVKGCVDPDIFIKEIQLQYGEEQSLAINKVKYEFWRWIPLPKGYEQDMQAIPAKKGSRGAFQVTFIEVIP